MIGVVLAGLLGGPKVGIGAGIIAGFHRFTLGGFTGIACGLASIVAGLLAGFFRRKNEHVKLSSAFFIGAAAEAVQMLIILGISRPMEKAVTLVQMIGIPMIVANGLGSALFLLIIKNVINEEEKAGAFHAQKTLRIADQTLVHLRDGINNKSALAVCQILHKELQMKAVAITNHTEILAHVGIGDDHHRPGSPIQTQITRDVIEHGEIAAANVQTIHCQQENCPLGAAIVAPLKLRGETIGTLKFYFTSEKEMTNLLMELISGLSVLLSNQLEIAEADKAYQLAKEAEIKALQAQISPHFLFNSLNTIISLVRIEPAQARKLLVSLSHFLRQNLTATTVSCTTLEQELKHVKAYLSIEETRFVDRLEVIYDIEEEALSERIPPLTLQPIVENAVKHGIKDKEHDCLIKIEIMNRDGKTIVKVKDNGQGMSMERADQIGKETLTSKSGSGLALYNINRRLSMMFGEEASCKLPARLASALSFNSLFHKRRKKLMDKTIRALIADDERYSRDELKHLMEKFPAIQVVGEAESGEATVMKAIQLQPDVVFLDVEMPKMNGMEAAKSLYELKKCRSSSLQRPTRSLLLKPSAMKRQIIY